LRLASRIDIGEPVTPSRFGVVVVVACTGVEAEVRTVGASSARARRP
jgi:hypothetical protein